MERKGERLQVLELVINQSVTHVCVHPLRQHVEPAKVMYVTPKYNWFLFLGSVLIIACRMLHSSDPISFSLKNSGKNSFVYSLDDSCKNKKLLEPLKQAIGNSRFVFIGESSHGIETFNALKFNLIQYLHQELNFEVIAFETGFYESNITNEIKDSLTPDEILARSLKVIWWTPINCQLMEYVKYNRLAITGVDAYTTTRSFKQKHYYWLLKEAPMLAHQVYRLDSLYFYYVKNKVHKTQRSCGYTLDSLRNYLKDRYAFVQKKIQQDTSISYQVRNILKKAIHLRMYELTYIGTKKLESQAYYIRDSIMADNLLYIADSLYPDKKIIIWAHNAHITKSGIKDKKWKGYSMRKFLDKKIGKDSFVIALNAWGGKYTKGYEEKNFKKRVPKSYLEYWLYRIPYDRYYIISNTSRIQKGNYSLLKKKQYEWGSYYKSSLIDKYDALIFCKNTKPAVRINYFQKETIRNNK